MWTSKGRLVVDAERGSLHECRGRRWLGRPKTPSSARRVALPPFLVGLLRRHLEVHPFEFVFTTSNGTWLWRSTFDRRVLRPAIDGRRRPGVRAYAVCPGLTFHGLRHSHKTWLVAGGAPEIVQARRLGHHLPVRVVETYSHVAREVETRLLADLQRRWHKATRSQRPARPARQERAAASLRPPIPPSRARRQSAKPAVPIPVGTRDTSRDIREGTRNRAVGRVGPWSKAPQKHPTRDAQFSLETITRDHRAGTRKPLRPAPTA
ncbi:tyrosine-type recombinase/integrase [Amycolatopsis echigonensis]|uniref:tyrosine-type recombinase/integrase n=1 Tax=Amycolatopsis echigonensis TaxID=2576905 RepID=UPI000C711880